MTNNKEKILIAAMDLFHGNGFQSTGLEDILSTSGVCKSNFYYHFKSKEELGVRVIERKVEQMRTQFLVHTLDNPQLNAKLRILGLFQRMLEFCEEQGCRKGCFFGNLSLELSDHREELRRPLSQFFTELQQKVEACLVEGTRKKELTGTGMSPRELALAIVSLLQGGLLLMKTHKEASSMRASIKLLAIFVGEERGGEPNAS
ncbi:HTH-type transcriptional repressor NemR [compost metagenome]